MFRKYMFQPIHLAGLVDELNLDKAIRKLRYRRKSATKKEKNVQICGLIFLELNQLIEKEKYNTREYHLYLQILNMSQAIRSRIFSNYSFPLHC